MTDHPQFWAERIAWMFKKSGGEGEHTKVFENLPELEKGRLLSEARLLPGEVPALAYIAANEGWVLVTNQRVVWYGAGELRAVSFAHLVDATVEPRDLLAARSKSAFASLTLRTDAGEAHRLGLEAGPPFAGVWNAIKMMVRREPS